jgi:hypothetical protein
VGPHAGRNEEEVRMAEEQAGDVKNLSETRSSMSNLRLCQCRHSCSSPCPNKMICRSNTLCSTLRRVVGCCFCHTVVKDVVHHIPSRCLHTLYWSFHVIRVGSGLLSSSLLSERRCQEPDIHCCGRIAVKTPEAADTCFHRLRHTWVGGGVLYSPPDVMVKM